MRRLLLLSALLLCCTAIQAQGVRSGDERPVISAQIPGGVLYSVPFATINFCNSPNVGVPCVNKATTYTDLTLSTPCPTSTQIVLAGTTNCIGTTDGFGNWGVNVAVGTYTYTIQLPSGASLGPFTVTLASGGGGGGSGNVTPANSGQVGGYLSNGSTISGIPNISFAGGTLILGNAGVVIGSIGFANLTSGSLTLQPPTGPLGTFVINLPNVGNGTLVEDNLSSVAQFGFPFWNGIHLLGNSPPPTTNCNWLWASNVTAGVAVQPSAECPGILPRAISGATTTDIITSGDNVQKVVHYFAATGTLVTTLPTPTTLGIPDFTYKQCNDSPQTDSIVPTTWTIQAGSNPPAASLSIAPGNCFIITIDPAGGNWLADISGVGLGNVTASSLTLGRVALGGGGVSLLTDNGDMKCSAFSGADWGLIITSCLSTMQAFNSISGNADARGVSNSTIASVNPIAQSNTMPSSGKLLMGPGTYQTNVPIVDHSDWSIEGESVRGNDTQVGTTIKAGAGFQATYTTGTITVGTPGAAEVITGSGTTWTAAMVGCAFYGANGGTNSTFGIITIVGSATSITLGWGQNVGTGAAGGSAYSITCPIHAHGSGGSSASGAQFGMSATNINFDCNAVAGCIGDLNWFGQQGTYDKNVGIHNSVNIGLDLENQNQQSGPWDNVTVSMGTGCASSAIPIVVRGNETFRGITNSTTGKGACATTPAVGIAVNNNGTQIINPDLASTTIGVLLGGNVACPVACANLATVVSNSAVINPFAEATVTTAVQISNALGTGQGNIVTNVTNAATNALIDQPNSCTITDTRLANYITSSAGKIFFNSQNAPAAACMVLLAPYTFATLPAAANGVAPVFCSDCNATCTAGASTGQYCIRTNGTWTH